MSAPYPRLSARDKAEVAFALIYTIAGDKADDLR
jgi:hypothetical protein